MSPMFGIRPIELFMVISVFAAAAMIDRQRGVSFEESRKRLIVYAVVVVVGLVALWNFVELRTGRSIH